ncbi:MAG TPA: hypothetical protein VFU94_02520 [Conexibacter sp.]|nr:hypothetical protein [Conexibacter sp.]
MLAGVPPSAGVEKEPNGRRGRQAIVAVNTAFGVIDAAAEEAAV